MSPQLDIAVLVAVLTACAIYLCLSRRFARVLFGFILLSNAANLVMLSMSGDPTGKGAATIHADAPLPMVDPLPQALILTAIVIGFSVIAYLTVMMYRIYVDGGSATTPSLDDGDVSEEVLTRRGE